MVISNQAGLHWRTGGAAVVRPWNNEYYQQMQWVDNKIVTLRGMCLEIWGGADTHHNYLTFWKCHGGPSNKWNIDLKAKKFPKYPLQDGVKFQIKSSTHKEFAIYPHDHLGNNQYWLRERYSEPFDDKQWWTFDSRSNTIRYWSNRNQVIGTYYHHRGFLGGYYNGQYVYLKNFEGNHFDNIKFTLRKGGNMRNHGGFCLVPQSSHHA